MSSNPMIKSPRIEETTTILEGKPMTIAGSVNKTLLLLAIVVICALGGWQMCVSGYSDKAMLTAVVSAVAGLILAIITSFNPKASPITAPAYALCEGLVVGIISFSYNSLYDGIIPNAVGITLLALCTMLFLYKTKALQATETFKKVVMTATIAIAIFYFVGFIASLLGHPMTVFNGGIYGIIISSVICIIAAFNFIIDFDFIEKGSENLYPSYFEWYGGFALLVTVIWLYFEILRLLAQLNKRN